MSIVPDQPEKEGALAGFVREMVTVDGRARPVYRTGSGPAVIVIAEVPGITPKVAEFGRRVAGIGCTAVLPELFGQTGEPPSVGAMAKTMLSVCISREFALLATNKTSPVTTWLRALAKEEHARCGGPGVGVIGMCLTGNFALGMMVDDTIVAPVLSQPSLPVGFTRRAKGALGLSDADLARVKERVAGGTCVYGLRFTGDPLCVEDRFDTLRRELGDGFVAIELDSSPGNPYGHPKNAHSVVTEHLDDRPGTPTREALDRVLGFFSERLLSGTAPG